MTKFYETFSVQRMIHWNCAQWELIYKKTISLNGKPSSKKWRNRLTFSKLNKCVFLATACRECNQQLRIWLEMFGHLRKRHTHLSYPHCLYLPFHFALTMCVYLALVCHDVNQSLLKEKNTTDKHAHNLLSYPVLVIN